MPAPLPPFVQALGQGVHVVDTGFNRAHFDAAYLVVQDGHAAFIDTGVNAGVPRLLEALSALGLAHDAVDYVIPTHVHLDHAGGAGALMRALPQARLLVHARGARHLIDPAALWAGAAAVYGEGEVRHAYGELIPVPAERVLATHDGMQVELGGRALHFADTPGHARHHHCVWDEATRGWFTGDTFGLSYPELHTPSGPWMLPTSTPVQFEPELLMASIERLLAARPQCMYLTHFGRLSGAEAVQRLGRQLLDLLHEMAALGRSLQRAGDRHAALKRGQMDLFMSSLQAHGCAWPREQVEALLALDLELNAQGMAAWLDRSERATA